MEQFMNLAEAANNLNDIDIESLMQSAICGDLSIFAMAKGWAVQGDTEMPPNNLKGQVYLLAEDLEQGLGAQSIPVCQVRMPESDEIITLLETQQVRRGILYITTKEFDRFRRQHGLTLKHGAGSLPYLNPHHDCYAAELAIAVEAWMTIFGDDNFQPRGMKPKTHIERWLSARNARLPDNEKLSDNARGRIATLVNPIKAKKGGAPSTFAE
jgi:hypothetical protein